MKMNEKNKQQNLKQIITVAANFNDETILVGYFLQVKSVVIKILSR
jgi:hypothetical protein